MYLSRLILNPRNNAVRRDLSDCQELHRTILSGFPDLHTDGMDARQKFGVLHRVDIHSRSGAIVLLVQSMEMPNWSLLPAGYLIEGTEVENPACKQISRQYSNIKDGDILAFRLRANPTKKTGTSRIEDLKTGKPKSNGRRIPVNGERDQLLWLKRKGDDCGFELITAKPFPEMADVLVSDEGSCTTYVKGNQRPISTKMNHLSFASVLFEGKLKVTDSSRFQETLKIGIGSGKAYGFGLLSIAPPR